MTAKGCSHVAGIQTVTPSASAARNAWKAAVGGCICGSAAVAAMSAVATIAEQARNRGHFHATGHPVIGGYDPPEGWGWCYVDQVVFDLSKRRRRRAVRSRALSGRRLDAAVIVCQPCQNIVHEAAFTDAGAALPKPQMKRVAIFPTAS